jgi:hypothetical protein
MVSRTLYPICLIRPSIVCVRRLVKSEGEKGDLLTCSITMSSTHDCPIPKASRDHITFTGLNGIRVQHMTKSVPSCFRIYKMQDHAGSNRLRNVHNLPIQCTSRKFGRETLTCACRLHDQVHARKIADVSESIASSTTLHFVDTIHLVYVGIVQYFTSVSIHCRSGIFTGENSATSFWYSLQHDKVRMLGFDTLSFQISLIRAVSSDVECTLLD